MLEFYRRSYSVERMRGNHFKHACVSLSNISEFSRPLSKRFTQLQAFLGEFVIGDNGMTLRHTTGLLIRLQCCDHDNSTRMDHPQCAPIPIPPSDVLRQRFAHQKCMEFDRSLPCARCKLGPRMLASSSTAAQDLNSVYGVSTDMLKKRRTMLGGLLKSQIINGHEIYAVERFNSSGRFRCFEGDCEISPQDVRNLHLPTGLAFSLLFHRNHNRHARQLAKIRPNWNDAKLFQEARKWNIAEYQHIIYNEYFETLVGAKLANFFGLFPKPPGQFSKYKPDEKLKTIIEFQTTAGRHGHAALIEDIFIIDRKTRREFKINFRQSELVESIFYEGHVDGMFLAQMSRQAFETTPSIPFKTFLYHLPGRTFGLDLAASDIQRQRDHGIPGYIRYLKYLHNVVVQCWEDLVQFIDSENIDKLKKHYKYVEDIELYVGGHYERKSDALVGPTFATIIGIQFHNAKYGDRFFYEHGDQIGSFKIEQLNEIKTKTSFASILCKNTDLDHVLPEPLRLQSYSNQFVPCSVFRDLDYNL